MKRPTEGYAVVPSRPIPATLAFSLVPIASWFIVRPMLDPAPQVPALYAAFGFSLFAFLATIYLIPALSEPFFNAGLFGKDLLKAHADDGVRKPWTVIPESMGLVCASVYILELLLFIPFAFSSAFAIAPNVHEGLAVIEFPHHQLSVYLSSLLSLLIATMLGFLDDLFDIRWRHKIPVPIIASIPLLMVYYAESGNTHVVVPIPLRFMFGTLVNLGPLYYIYMSLLSTFSTNSINILAGINGSEVGQALIIALSVILNDLLYLPWPIDFRIPLHLLGNKAEVGVGGAWSAGMAYGSKQLVERHLFSLYFMLPLFAVCAGLMYHNWYPAKAFPGDTLCYFSGMAFSVVGIQAHFSKTLLLFFIPQIFNFLLSCPQLFGLVPNPRHRVPEAVWPSEEERLVHGLSRGVKLLHYSKVRFEKKPPSTLAAVVLRTLSTLGCVKLIMDPSGRITETSNLTILNFFLIRLGPMSEKRLVQVLLASQISGSALAFLVRYGLAGLVYDGDRR